MEAEQPIIVIKKKGGHGGHHGGAWKVAYADFVTAMMSLFIVLWLMSSTSKETQKEIAGYFRDPKGVSAKHGANPKPDDSKEAKPKKEDLALLKMDLLQAIHQINALEKLKNQIQITVTEEGLRIELLEAEQGTFFEVGSAQPTPVLDELLKVLAGQLKDLPNSISIEGHTDSRPYLQHGTYGNWELSTDRANVARREMQSYGIRLNQISQVRGFADQRLHLPDKPYDPSNRRVSLVVQNLGGDVQNDAIADKAPAAAQPAKAEGSHADAPPHADAPNGAGAASLAMSAITAKAGEAEVASSAGKAR
jgi:chemotaxis protein MotB